MTPVDEKKCWEHAAELSTVVETYKQSCAQIGRINCDISPLKTA